ncbi:MAG: DHA2 family efflux MFS transporter permease subunit [Microthrixaceae bacterium]|nr:DHA2 family efflux MFS transporter permease subunit [Microthrixaceae bacterium]
MSGTGHPTAATLPPDGRDPGGTRRAPALTLLATGLGLFMVFLDATIVNVALPAIQSDFDVGESGVQWVVAAYSLTMGMFMMTSASLSDSYGRRRAFVLGIALFSVASLVCGIAPSLAVLNIARGLQGIGAAVVNVASLALVGAAYPEPAAKARAVGLWTGIAAIGIAVGPTVGGFLTEQFSWRAVFIVNPVVGLLTVVLTYAFVSESASSTRHSFDIVGQLMFIVGVGAVTFALVEAPQYGFGSPLIVGSLVLSVAVLVVFVRFELRSSDPMMDVRVFGDIAYTGAILTMLASLFAAYGSLLVITQYFQNVRDFSPERAGLLMLSFSLPAMVFAPIAGRLAGRFGGRRPALGGLALVTLGSVTLAVSAGRNVALTCAGLFLLGCGVGLSVSPATAMAMATISPERSGMASGILSAQRAIGSTAGFAVMGSLLALVVGTQLPEKLEPVIPDSSDRDAVVQDVVDAANPSAVPGTVGPKSDPIDRDEAIAAADDVFVDGIRIAESSGALVAFGVLVFGWFAFPRTRSEESAEELGVAAALERSPDEPAVRRVVESARGAGVPITPYRFIAGLPGPSEVAAAMGVDAERFVETLVFEADGAYVLAVIGGSRALDEASLASAAGSESVRSPDPERVREVTGFEIGGVPPFGLAGEVTVFVEQTLLQQPSLWAPAGTPRDVFEVEPEVLVHLSNATAVALHAGTAPN